MFEVAFRLTLVKLFSQSRTMFIYHNLSQTHFEPVIQKLERSTISPTEAE
jgi:hypothetical protein